MHISPLATAALILHIPFIIYLFSAMKVERATAISLLSGILLLPEGIEFDPPGLPPVNKYSITVIVTFLFVFFKKTEGGSKKSLFFSIMSVILIGGIVGTGLTNRDTIMLAPVRVGQAMGFKDIFATSVQSCFSLLMPFYIGRKVYRTRESVTELLKVMTGFGVVYGLFMLVEVRMAPMMNVWVYGYHQGDFGQMMRNGGFRPIVFMAHGLATVMFLLTALLSAITLQRMGERVWNIQTKHLASFMGIVLLVSNSMGVLVYLAAVAPLMWVGKPKAVSRFATIVAVLVLAIPILRFTQIFPIDWLLEQFAKVNVDRAASLKFRFDNETLFIEKWALRPLFGWGGYGRARIYNDLGHDVSVTDGEWIIALSHLGIVGFLGEFLLLLGPIWIARKHISKLANPALRYCFAGLVLIVAIRALDLVPNGLFSFLPVLLAGSLYGFSESLSDPLQRHLTEGGTPLPTAPEATQSSASIDALGAEPALPPPKQQNSVS